MGRQVGYWKFLISVVLMGIWVHPVLAQLSVIPAEPQVGDTVRVEVRSGFGTMCWVDTGQTCEIGSGDSLRFTVYVDYCRGQPFCVCAQYPRSYDRICNFGVLPAGTYTVVFTERHDSPYDPEETHTSSLQFTVSNPTPVHRQSWGRIKILYR
jgi:hypothetical protein